MIRLVELDQYKLPYDRNGLKLNIGREVLIKLYSKFISGVICGFSNNYEYVYIIAKEFGVENLYKRKCNNIVIVNQLSKWNNK